MRGYAAIPQAQLAQTLDYLKILRDIYGCDDLALRQLIEGFELKRRKPAGEYGRPKRER